MKGESWLILLVQSLLSAPLLESVSLFLNPERLELRLLPPLGLMESNFILEGEEGCRMEFSFLRREDVLLAYWTEAGVSLLRPDNLISVFCSIACISLE